MWTAYKKEIMAKEKKQKDFLKKYYQQSKTKYNHDNEEPEPESGDWPIQLDSDEEPLPEKTSKHQ